MVKTTPFRVFYGRCSFYHSIPGVDTIITLAYNFQRVYKRIYIHTFLLLYYFCNLGVLLFTPYKPEWSLTRHYLPTSPNIYGLVEVFLPRTRHMCVSSFQPAQWARIISLSSLILACCIK